MIANDYRYSAYSAIIPFPIAQDSLLSFAVYLLLWVFTASLKVGPLSYTFSLVSPKGFWGPWWRKTDNVGIGERGVGKREGGGWTKVLYQLTQCLSAALYVCMHVCVLCMCVRDAINKYRVWRLLKRRTLCTFDVCCRYDLQSSPCLSLGHDPSDAATFGGIPGSCFPQVCGEQTATLLEYPLKSSLFWLHFQFRKQNAKVVIQGPGNREDGARESWCYWAKAAESGGQHGCALSWWGSHVLFHHLPDHFLLTMSRKHLKTWT